MSDVDVDADNAMRPAATANPPVWLEERDDRFYVATSTIPNAGLGLFARVPLAAGATFEVIGVLVARESVADRCSHYTDPYKYRVNGALLIPVGFGAMVNHAVDSNLERVAEGHRLYLRTRRAIAEGEELLLTYGGDAVRRFPEPGPNPQSRQQGE